MKYKNLTGTPTPSVNPNGIGGTDNKYWHLYANGEMKTIKLNPCQFCGFANKVEHNHKCESCGRLMS